MKTKKTTKKTTKAAKLSPMPGNPKSWGIATSYNHARAHAAAVDATKQDAALFLAKGGYAAAHDELMQAIGPHLKKDKALRAAFGRYLLHLGGLLGAQETALYARNAQAIRLVPEATIGRKVYRPTARAGKASGEARRDKSSEDQDEIRQHAERYRHLKVMEAAFHIRNKLFDAPSISTVYRAIRPLWKKK